MTHTFNCLVCKKEVHVGGDLLKLLEEGQTIRVRCECCGAEYEFWENESGELNHRRLTNGLERFKENAYTNDETEKLIRELTIIDDETCDVITLQEAVDRYKKYMDISKDPDEIERELNLLRRYKLLGDIGELTNYKVGYFEAKGLLYEPEPIYYAADFIKCKNCGIGLKCTPKKIKEMITGSDSDKKFMMYCKNCKHHFTISYSEAELILKDAEEAKRCKEGDTIDNESESEEIKIKKAPFNIILNEDKLVVETEEKLNNVWFRCDNCNEILTIDDIDVELIKEKDITVTKKCPECGQQYCVWYNLVIQKILATPLISE